MTRTNLTTKKDSVENATANNQDASSYIVNATLMGFTVRVVTASHA